MFNNIFNTEPTAVANGKNHESKSVHLEVLPPIPVAPPLAARPKAVTAVDKKNRGIFFQLDAEVTDWFSDGLTQCENLYMIFKDNLWSWGGYRNYAHYIEVKFYHAQSTAYQYKDVGRVYTILSSAKAELPAYPNQLKPLLSLKDDKQIVKVWNKAVQSNKIVTENQLPPWLKEVGL
jgi:hypothetical protein